jgi:putative ABC transport system permease protein
MGENGESDMRRIEWWHGVGQDVVYAWRMLRRAPLFTATALVTIAVGVGATTAIFSVVNDVLLRRLPYPSSDRLLLVWNAYTRSPAATNYTAIAAAEFSDMRDARGALDGVAALSPQPSTLTGGCTAGGDCEPERVSSYVVSPNLFELLGVRPAAGRSFAASDGADSAEKVAVLSDALWRRRFGADHGVVGRTVDIGGRARTIIGVMPAGVRFPDAPLGFLKEPADVWLPYSWEQRRSDGRGNQYLAVIARVGAGLPLARAQTDLDTLASSFRAQFADRYARPGSGWSIAAVSLRDQMVGDVRPELFVLLGAVGLVLLIACANVANLLLARGSARRRELAVRSALGAGRTRLVQQLLVETAVLTLSGGIIGVIIAAWGMGALIQLDPGSIPRLEGARVDGVVLAFSLGVTILTGVLVGLAPALRQSSQASPRAALGDGTRGGPAAPLRRGLRSALVVAEVAMALIVLVGAGLLVRSFAALSHVHPGFDPSNIVSFQLTPPRAQYDTSAKVLAFHQQVVDRLAALPGVTQASAVYPLPMGGDQWSGSFGVEGLAVDNGRPQPHAEYHVALPGYFHIVRIPLLDGREFTREDVATAPSVAVVDEALAKQYWPGQSAVGKRLDIFGGSRVLTTVVGVVGHVHVAGPRTEGEPQIYLPLTQSTQAPLFFVARTAGDPAPVVAAAREAVRAADSRLAVAKLGPMSILVARAVARERFNMLLFTMFGAVALTLAAVGLYGVTAFLVAQRTREIGIRLALGGQPGQVLRRVIREGLVLTLVGIGIGLAVALPLSRTLRELLFAIEPTDPVTYAGIAALLLAVTLAAAYGPARRATRVDPIEVLRS